ncbi:hypothetical protein P280DRAFT_230394 [Massarina eburnea CBS 473.64]|uniref:Uncharacterized protein n=1 Tax=Massarina eburnea CBS 473.64 TaxID=1395130 RepID=A0A6A6S9B9_9PLEO|nr:hypothetical protein P280DRAFT_230394 [Massarina eburnea CBS 473.64]
MKIVCFMTFSYVVGVTAGPLQAKRDCEETCFNSTNACGIAFGGCWKKCEQQRPTFTAPLCPVTITEATAASTATEIETSVTETTLITLAPEITAAPTESSLAASTPTSGCNPGVTICIDYVTTCGDRTFMYGGCDDICSSISYTAPACTVPAVTATLLPGNGTEASPTKTKAKGPPTTRTPCKSDKSWMCAPAGW